MKLARGLVAAAIIAQLASCAFAVKHPAITVGIVGGTVGLGSCELATENHKACFAVGGSVAAVLGLITAVAMWTMGGEPDAHVLRDEALENSVRADSGSGGPLDPPPADPATPEGDPPTPAPANPASPGSLEAAPAPAKPASPGPLEAAPP